MDSKVVYPSKQRPGSFPAIMQYKKEPIVGRPISAKENLKKVFNGGNTSLI